MGEKEKKTPNRNGDQKNTSINPMLQVKTTSVPHKVEFSAEQANSRGK